MVGEKRSRATPIGAGPSAISHNVYYVRIVRTMAGTACAAVWDLDTESATCVTAN